MFVVKRPFRDASGMFTAGMIVNPEEIKGLRYRIRENHLVEVTEKNFDEYADYFLQRYGVILGKEETTEVKVEEVKPEPVKPAAAKAAVKVVAK